MTRKAIRTRTADVAQRLDELERELRSLRQRIGEGVVDWPETSVPVLTFQAAAMWMALPVAVVAEVLPMAWCEPLPDAPTWLLGALRIYDKAIRSMRCWFYSMVIT